MLMKDNLEPFPLANWSGEKQLSLITFFFCRRPLSARLPSSHLQLRETCLFTLERIQRTYPALSYLSHHQHLYFSPCLKYLLAESNRGDRQNLSSAAATAKVKSRCLKEEAKDDPIK